MTILWHEMKRGKVSLWIWSLVIGFMLGICVLIYPEMASEMEIVSDIFSNMGSFSSAFGMDSLNFGEFMGYFAIECGNTLGLGGGFFAAVLGISMLAKEEKQKTAEFLLTHPLKRRKIVLEKWLAMMLQIAILNISVLCICFLAVLAVGVDYSVSKILLLFLVNFIMQIEIASITFMLGALFAKIGVGAGIGISVLFYFLNLLSNLSGDVEFLKFVTPYGYKNGADILKNGIDVTCISIGAMVGIACILVSFWQYERKDIL